MNTKKIVSGLVTSTMMLSMVLNPVSATESKTYTKVVKDYYTVTTEAGERKESTTKIAIVTNPNGGAKLGYVDGVTELIEVSDGGYTYAFKDMNKNGKLDTYEDWRLSVDERASSLANELVNTEEMVEVVIDTRAGTTVTVPKGIAQIAGLMLFSSHERDSHAGLSDNQKAYLSNSYVRNITDAAGNNVKDAVGWTNAMQAFVEASDFNVPVDFSSDPRSTAGSGDLYSKNSTGDSISGWPSNIGMGATFSEEHMYNFAKATSAEYRALGIVTALGPQIEITTEPRWLRLGGTFGESSKLSTLMAQAYVDGSQSTYVDGEDIGWGEDSINCMIKHFPGDGLGEGGRESHTNAGKYGVYPGNNFEEHLIPFTEGGMNLKGKTKTATAVMTSYSIGIDAEGNPLGGQAVGSSYSKFKLDLLRNEIGFDGVVCTDWGVTSTPGFFGMAWGTEKMSVNDRHYEIINNGTDMFGGNNDNKPICYAYDKMVNVQGEEAAKARFAKSAERLIKLTMAPGMFENPYLDLEESLSKAGSEEKMVAGYAAQLDSVVMLKNDGVIKAAKDQEKDPKDMVVYIPKTVDGKSASLFGGSPAHVTEPINMEVAKSIYGTVLTDEITIETDEAGNITNVTVQRPTVGQLKAVDLVIVGMRSPNNGDQFSNAGHDRATNTWYPLSIQYGEYVADGENVRKESISGDILADGTKENRSYYGQKAKISNSYDLTAVLGAAEAMEEVGNDAPVVAYINAGTGFLVHEFEEAVDAILVGFSVTDKAVLEIINGNHEPKGLMPFQIGANMDTIEANLEDVAGDLECYVDSNGNTYDFAYGMNWSGVINDERVQKFAYNPPAPPVVEPETPVVPEIPTVGIHTSTVAVAAMAVAALAIVALKRKED